MFSADFVAADDHETDYEFGVGSDDDDQIGDGEPRYKQLLIMNNFVKWLNIFVVLFYLSFLIYVCNIILLCLWQVFSG